MRTSQRLLSLLVAGTAAILASAASGQVSAKPPIVLGQFGFQAGNGANTAGTLCSGFSCTATQLSVKANDKVGFVIRAPQNAKYFMIVGPAPTLCQTFPGFLNKWVVPAAILLPGVVNQVDMGPRCFGYMSSFSATVPANVQKGTRVSFQVLAEVNSPKGPIMPAFSSPIEIIVP